eukprot:GHVU01106959.1.p1 GENE.GHVU01106959.1~~GHVU01106959.1.p1  ORF type:complete len:134 (-),score=12.55 GHVU01106959.1:683-1084(-)
MQPQIHSFIHSRAAMNTYIFVHHACSEQLAQPWVISESALTHSFIEDPLELLGVEAVLNAIYIFIYISPYIDLWTLTSYPCSSSSIRSRVGMCVYIATSLVYSHTTTIPILTTMVVDGRLHTYLQQQYSRYDF